jgi:hypothetical protein
MWPVLTRPSSDSRRQDSTHDTDDDRHIVVVPSGGYSGFCPPGFSAPFSPSPVPVAVLSTAAVVPKVIPSGLSSRWVSSRNLDRLREECTSGKYSLPEALPSCFEGTGRQFLVESLGEEEGHSLYGDLTTETEGFGRAEYETAYAKLVAERVSFSRLNPGELLPRGVHSRVVLIHSVDTVLPICYVGLNRSVAMHHLINSAQQHIPGMDIRVLHQIGARYLFSGKSLDWRVRNKLQPDGWRGERPLLYGLEEQERFRDTSYLETVTGKIRREIAAARERRGVFRVFIMAGEAVCPVIKLLQEVLSGHERLSSSVVVHVAPMLDYIANPDAFLSDYNAEYRRLIGSGDVGVDVINKYFINTVLAPAIGFSFGDRTG